MLIVCCAILQTQNTSNMSIPPFPSQDLAKLVLGYLAEEQLMTAYDEFLQASPYLDALGNEYDRIFMTSLKNILAEYRAVKIYVETCKPFALRRKLFQFTNLLEIVKFLIQYVDINKLQTQEGIQNKYSTEKQSVITSLKPNLCDVCNSSKLESCTCQTKNISVSSTQSISQISTSSVENSIETTSLSDLPGNHVTCRKKSPRFPNKDQSEISLANEQTDTRLRPPTENDAVEKSPPISTVSRKKIQDTTENTSTLEKEDTLENRQKEEFYNILNQVCKKNETITNTNLVTNPDVDDGPILVAGTAGYKEFATGVTGGECVNIVPDSSTSENLHVHVPTTKDAHNTTNLDQNEKMQQTITQYLLKTKNNAGIPANEIVSINTVSTFPKTKAKTDESKIRILSDIKVDKNESLGATASVPLKLKNATSTPLLQMQTILINGTPVYKHHHLGQSKNYTKDEIMAMPTIILAPAPDRSLVRQSSVSDSKQHIPMTSSSARPLGPLIIDVTSDNTAYLNQISSTDQGIVPAKESKESKESNAKIADITSASAPKDNTVTCNIETSTPQGLPPFRKSSSTPRRTSHVRVLDFTTPRRILHETINECVPNMTDNNDVEVIISKSPNLAISAASDKGVASDKTEDNSGGLKENSIQPKIDKKNNWDADLRKHALSSDVEGGPKPKPRPKSTKKRKTTKSVAANKANDTGQDKCDVKKKTPKTKLSKRKCSIDEISEVITIPDEIVDVPIKPTINIIAGDVVNITKDRVLSSSEKNIKSQNKSNSDENIDTPEMERMSLQNEIGAKLNISDLLETPYKQALYDIQMETPRFLGPDIPDDPMSDIKIMNIPTPRFLTNATPSSYSSRPTDYSSGGSYYKPDDQDYMRIQDDLDCPVTSTKQNTTNNSLSIKDDSDSKEKENLKPSRPVRECTRNVSYKRGKPKHVENKEDSDTSSADSVILADLAGEKEIPKKIDTKIKPSKNKPLAVKKNKSPIKKDKSFMKIKPRRPTPTKKDGRGRKKISDPSNHSNVQTRKKVGNKKVNENVTPVVTCVPTKSRRKSSTPRKLHCSKTFNSESSGHDSPDLVSKSKDKIPDSNVIVQDSDTEQLPLRWSDDGSQEPKPVVINVPIESEDINKIQEYIDTTVLSKTCEKEGSLHIDLVKRGFDLETAKIIERDLLDSTPQPQESPVNHFSSKAVETIVVVENKQETPVLEKTLESDCSNNLQIVQNDEEEDDDEIELSVHECNEESANYISCSHDATKDTRNTELTKLKDKFCMEVCIDDSVSIRLRATPFSVMLDQDPQPVEFLDYSYRETEIAVSSISNFDKLYTPLKDSIKSQCYEIFDSTLTSLDTPLKVSSPKNMETEVSVTEIILEVEKVEVKEKVESKKRKRAQSGNLSDEGSVESKKSKPETQYNLFSSANIQNIDIESVLSKLHGP